MGLASFDFSGKVAVVTGAASGIGREIALAYAANGAKVVVSDIDEDRGKEVVLQIVESKGKASFFPCDVSKPGQVEALVVKAATEHGAIHMTCNDAGIEGESGSIVEGTVENFQRVIDINLKGVWLCLKYQIPELIKAGGGSIVNVSSIAGLIGFPGLPAYVASKHGVIGLTKTAALENAEKNVRVNAVCPGPIMTPMLERFMDTTPGFKEQILAGVPEHRIGQPKDVAQTIMFLSSDQAAYITGQALAIDGGWVAQ
jgi:NAD(P)-dependent dehydrogenase (short-subunit alcohol dehydrogenase family)